MTASICPIPCTIAWVFSTSDTLDMMRYWTTLKEWPALKFTVHSSMSNHLQYSLTCFYLKTQVQSKLNPLQLCNPILNGLNWVQVLKFVILFQTCQYSRVSLYHEETNSYHYGLIVNKRVRGLHWYAILCKKVSINWEIHLWKKVSKLLLRCLYAG